jgi:hypothetical protein
VLPELSALRQIETSHQEANQPNIFLVSPNGCFPNGWSLAATVFIASVIQPNAHRYSKLTNIRLPTFKRGTRMPMKLLGSFVGLLGLAMIAFAVMTWRELRSAATSELAPTADSMPLTRFVYPELFKPLNPGGKAAKPAELAQAAFNRIYIIGGVSFALIVVGIGTLALPQNSRTGQNSS